MIILTPSTTLSIQLTSSPAAQLQTLASYIDIGLTSYTPNAVTGLSNNLTPTTIVASPTSPSNREVKFISIYNPNVGTVTTKLSVGSTQIIQIDLASLATIHYSDADGFKVIYTSGVNGSQGPAGANGATGAAGPTGPQGPAADTSLPNSNPIFISRWRDVVRF